jgi:nicotinamide-nucleotide amidase
LKAEIIAVGSEMLTPVRQDTNSLYLTDKLNSIGVAVHFKTIVGDRQRDLVRAIRTALSRIDILILMGGLGPTEDDLTREALAEALEIKLRRDPQLVAHLATRAAAMRFSMAPNNLKQADVLEGENVSVTILPNVNGSAPGQWVDTVYSGHRKLILLVPGPPHECRALFDSECLPRLRAALPARHIARRTLRAAMIPESQADALLAPIYSQFKDVETTILAHYGDIQLSLLCSKPSLEIADRRVQELSVRLEEALEDWLYSTGADTADSLAQIVLYFLGLRGSTLAVAESCTGGMIAARITDVPGSSRSFLGGAVVYADALKYAFAGVPPELIAEHGAVSAPVAEALARGIRIRTGATLGLGVTGIAGPTGGTDEKPFGLVYIALSDANKTECLERNIRGDRTRVREFTTQQSLDLIRRRLR